MAMSFADVAQPRSPEPSVVAPTNFAGAPVRWMRTVTGATTARAVRLAISPRSVPAFAPAASELTDDTVTPGDAKAGLATGPTSAMPTSATPAARTLFECI